MKFETITILEEVDTTIKLLHYEICSPELLDLAGMSDGEISTFHSFKSAKRKLEFYFTRLLWRQFELGMPIFYNENGKPKISSGYMSISHSKASILIGYSKQKEIGLDIEHYNPKIDLIKHKFLSEQEINQYDITDLTILTAIWSIKEAIYKMIDEPGLSFQNQIDVISLGDLKQVFVKTNKNESMIVFSNLIMSEFVISYCYKPA